MNCWSNTILSVDTESIVIPSGVCNDAVIHEIDLSNYRKMRSLHIGSSSYASVRELKLVGFLNLETVVIGANSFLFKGGGFYLQNCPRVREVMVGSLTFMNCTHVLFESGIVGLQ